MLQKRNKHYKKKTPESIIEEFNKIKSAYNEVKDTGRLRKLDLKRFKSDN